MPADLAGGVLDRLVDEVEEAFLELAGAALQLHRHGLALVGLATRVDVVQQLEKTLALEFRERLADGLALHFAIADELEIGRIGQLEHMVGIAQHRHHARRLREQLLQALVLLQPMPFVEDVDRRFADGAVHAGDRHRSRRAPASRKT